MENDHLQRPRSSSIKPQPNNLRNVNSMTRVRVDTTISELTMCSFLTTIRDRLLFVRNVFWIFIGYLSGMQRKAKFISFHFFEGRFLLSSVSSEAYAKENEKPDCVEDLNCRIELFLCWMMKLFCSF